jgi:hypothetical protein
MQVSSLLRVSLPPLTTHPSRHNEPSNVIHENTIFSQPPLKYPDKPSNDPTTPEIFGESSNLPMRQRSFHNHLSNIHHITRRFNRKIKSSQHTVTPDRVSNKRSNCSKTMISLKPRKSNAIIRIISPDTDRSSAFSPTTSQIIGSIQQRRLK